MRERELLDPITTYEASQILGTTPDNVRRMARLGQLPIALTTRNGRLYERAAIQRLAAERNAHRDRQFA